MSARRSSPHWSPQRRHHASRLSHLTVGRLLATGVSIHPSSATRSSSALPCVKGPCPFLYPEKPVPAQGWHASRREPLHMGQIRVDGLEDDGVVVGRAWRTGLGEGTKEEEEDEEVVVVVNERDETGVGMEPTPRHSSHGTVPKPEQ